MVAPLIAAAGRTAATSIRAEKGAEGRKAVTNKSLQGVQRSPEQNQARLTNARTLRQSGVLRGDIPSTSTEESRSQAEDQNLQQAQEQVLKRRALRAQVLLGGEEEANNQIEKEVREKPSFLWYTPAFAVASLKDLLDLVAIGSLPLIGTLVSFILGVLMFICLLFTRKNGSIADMKFVMRRFLVVTVTFLIEGFIVGVNFFPFEIGAVFLVFFMDRHLSEKQIAFLRTLARGIAKKPL